MKDLAYAITSVLGLLVLFMLVRFLAEVNWSDPTLDSAFWVKNVGGWVATLAAGGVAFVGVRLGLRGISSQIEAGRDMQANEFEDRTVRAEGEAWRKCQQGAASLSIELVLQRQQVFSRSWEEDLRDQVDDARTEGVVAANILNLEVYPVDRILSHMLPLVEQLPPYIVSSLVEYSGSLHHNLDIYILISKGAHETGTQASTAEMFNDKGLEITLEKMNWLHERSLRLLELVERLISSRSEAEFAGFHKEWKIEYDKLIAAQKLRQTFFTPHPPER